MTSSNGSPPAPKHNVIRNNFFINHPDEELQKYEGLFVAWSMDGRKVLASGKTPDDLGRAIKELRLGDDEWVFSYVEPPGGPARIGIVEVLPADKE
jgi:hypothetical protein